MRVAIAIDVRGWAGVCVENGSFYLVQEIVNGYGNLFDYLHKKNQRLTYWQCVQIAVGICDAMAYLHERHIVHRFVCAC